MRNKSKLSNKSTILNGHMDDDGDRNGGVAKFGRLLWPVVALLFAYAHKKHVETLFENEKHFSHLSNLERELSFRTENGLYYSYFKNLVVDRELRPLNGSLLGLINELVLNDNRTEYPSSINSLQRFNLYPEVIMAVVYRTMNGLGMLRKKCWKVNRGDDMPPIESCEGLLEPIYFYSNAVFVLHGLLMFTLFTLAYRLNQNSIASGMIACLCYFFNHGESTRVMWSPALRENFSFPFHLLQILALVNVIRQPDARKRRLFFTVTTIFYLLPWQFSQFSLATQTVSLFVTYSLGFLPQDVFLKILKLKSVCLTVCFFLQFANRMLLSSLYASVLVSLWVVVFVERYALTFLTNRNRNFLLQGIFLAVRLAIVALVMWAFKKYVLIELLQLEDDSHIWDILKSKFDPTFFTFDTRLYTCAPEFDFIEMSTIRKLTGTLLLPTAGLIFVAYGLKLAKKFVFHEQKNSEDALVMYNLLQLMAYTIIAVLIMRLKLFWTPYLCLIAGYVGNNSPAYDLASMVRIRGQGKLALVVLVVALMSYEGVSNVKGQLNIQGEYSSYSMELMMNWINGNTRADDAFAGSMPVMANVKLSTNRPIVNHPHYEDVGLRNRTKYIYSHMYGFRSVRELHQLLKNDYRVRYLIIEEHFCRSGPPGKPQCAMANIAQLSFNKTTTRSACDLIIDQHESAKPYFLRMFKKDNLNLFRLV